MHKIFLLSLLTVASASAAITTYTDQATFLAALASGSYIEDFSTITLGATANPLAFSGNGFSYDISSSGSLGAIEVLGDRSMSVGSFFDTLIINNFGGSPNAVGGYFYFDDAPNLATGVGGTVTASNGVDPDAVLNVTAPNSLTAFFGFISTSGPLTSVSIVRTSGDSAGYPNVDDLIVGQLADDTGVPEPSSMALMGFGLVAAGLLRMRASRK